MRSFALILFSVYLVVHSGAEHFPSWSNDENEIDFWDDGTEKRSESSSFSSRSSSSSSSSSSSDSSGAFHFKVEEYEQKTDKHGSHEITKIHEKKKPAGGNETSSSKTIEVFRFPNGTIQRKVKDNGPAMKAECTKTKDCSADKFCSKLSYQCQQCIDDFGCFSNDQCCGDKVCKLGRCFAEPERTGLAKSPCDDDSQCNAGLYCSYNVFDGGNCDELRKEGQSCNRGIFAQGHPKCAEGLECVRVSGFAGLFNHKKCLKEVSMEDKSSAGSPFDWFKDNWEK